MPLTYDAIVGALSSEALPALYVDLDAFDRNVARVASVVGDAGPTVRIATKSVRVPALIRRAIEKGGSLFRGLMCFCVEEAELLSREGFDDLFVAYPPFQAAEATRAAELVARGVDLKIAVDALEGLERLSRAGQQQGVKVPVVLCIDMSLRLVGDLVHLGVRRSPVATPEDALALSRLAAAMPGVELAGLMGYEAQVAGLADDRPGDPERWAKRAVRRASIHVVRERRAQVVETLRAAGHDLGLVNGGGTGSLDSTSRDPSVTEVSCGSAFFKPHAFDHFTNAHMSELEPSCFFALEVTRVPGPGLATCLGGGYVASGPVGTFAAPLPHLPEGLSLLPTEMAGEVQTPLRVPKSAKLRHGSPVVFRHAKGGEVCERFREVLLIAGGKIVGRAPTYRGLGACFF